MNIEIRPFTADFSDKVKAFNGRLALGKVEFSFPEQPVSGWLPKVQGRKIFEEYFLAVEGGSEVRGGYILKHQDFLLGGSPKNIGFYYLPLAESLLDNRYNMVGLQLLSDALRREPSLFALGMGDYGRPLPRMLRAMGWSMCLVPFFFRVRHPVRFLRNIAYLRKTWYMRLALDVLAVSGIGWLIFTLAQSAGKIGFPVRPGPLAEAIDEFSPWADELWSSCKDRYRMIAVRDRETLNILYPKGHRRYIRLKVSERGKIVGWAVLLQKKMAGHRQFGDMTVGAIVDAFASPEDAASVLAAAAGYLEQAGADIVVTNHSHRLWGGAAARAGFIKGRSNVIFAASRMLSGALSPFDASAAEVYLMRGDGDGPGEL